MSNPWVEFMRLIPRRAMLVGEVLSVDLGTHTSVVSLVGGGDIRARGDSVAEGSMCYIEDGVVISEAPQLPASSVEIL